MRSAIPPKFGDTPTKVVFEGVEPGSPEAQLLFHETAGEIGHFHRKARQYAEISEQPQTAMQQQMPDGGHMRYVSNNGQETIHVTLTPERMSAAIPKPTQIVLQDASALLAIDVLFDAKRYDASYINSYTATQVSTPGTPAKPPFKYPDDETLYLGQPDGSFKKGPLTAREVVGEDAWRGVESVGGAIAVTLPTSVRLAFGVDQYESIIARAQAEGPIDPYYRPGVVQTFVLVKFIDDGFHNYGWGIGGSAYYTTSVVSVGVTIPGVPATPGSTKTVKRYTGQKHQLLSTVSVVGAIGNPGAKKPEYTALSDGTPSKDDRLVSTNELKVVQSIDRELTALEDAAPPGFVGAGFLAQPVTPAIGGDGPGKTIIDIYVASLNSRVNNTFPDAERVKWDTDDKSFQYDIMSQLSGRVRAREFVDQQPGAVQVNVTSTMREQDLTAPGDDQQAVNPGPWRVIPEKPARGALWSFAAAPGWQDNGNEPALPTAVTATGASAMGLLMDEKSFTNVTFAVPSPTARKILTDPAWTQDIHLMTRLARVTWTPSKIPHLHGKAVIEMFTSNNSGPITPTPGGPIGPIAPVG